MIRYSVLAVAKLPNDESPPNHLADPCVWLRRASSLIAPSRWTSGVAGSEEQGQGPRRSSTGKRKPRRRRSAGAAAMCGGRSRPLLIKLNARRLAQCQTDSASV